MTQSAGWKVKPEGEGSQSREGEAGPPYLPPHEDIVPTLQLFVIKVV